MTDALQLALSNLTSVSVLVFALGFVAARLKSDIRIPEPVYQVISVYLLFGIGLKGGVALHHSGGTGVVPPALMTLLLGALVPTLAFLVLARLRGLGQVDRGAIAAHYGSTSLVTFTAALVYLDNAAEPYEGFVTTLLTIMEIPGIIVGIFLATRHLNQHVSWGESLREIVLGKTVLLLVGGLLVGVATGDAGYEKVAPFFVDLLPGVLALFLMHLGALAGQRIGAIRQVGPGLAIYALTFPLLSGTLGVVGGQLVGLSVGGATVLGILCASASYIAAPAAVQIALPQANPSLSITASLGVTFPFNLLVGIPLLHALSRFVAGL